MGVDGYVEWLAAITAPLEQSARHIECARLWRDALAFLEDGLGANHLDVANCLLKIAYNLNGQRQIADVEPLVDRALALLHGDEVALAPSERNSEKCGLLTAEAYSILAFAFQSLRRYSDAESLIRKALDIRLRILGDEHVATASCYRSLAAVLTQQKQAKEGEPYACKALEITIWSLGNDAPQTATAYAVLARNLLAQNRPDEAEALYRTALDIRRLAFGENHPRTAGSYLGLARSLSAQGRDTEAEPLIQIAQSIREHLQEQSVEIRNRMLREDGFETPDDYLSYARIVTGKDRQRKPRG